MKTLLAICIFFITTTCFAQYPVDWRTKPQNPIPLQYNTEHYLLYHNIKSVRYQEGFIDWLFEFNRDGNTTVLNDGVGKTKYSYDKNGHLESIKTKYTHAKYKTNEKGYIIEERYADGSGSIFEYNEEGLFSEKKDLATNITVMIYEYDDLGRLSTEIYNNGEGEFFQKSTYTYKDLMTQIEVTQSSVDVEGNTNVEKHYYSKRGERLSSDYKNDKITYDIKSNAIAHFKSATNTTTTFTITYY